MIPFADDDPYLADLPGEEGLDRLYTRTRRLGAEGGVQAGDPQRAQRFIRGGFRHIPIDTPRHVDTRLPIQVVRLHIDGEDVRAGQDRPDMYYVLSGNDLSLDINDPEAPRIVCMGNSPRKQEVYGAVLSLYVSRLVRQVNRPGRLPCSLVFDEFPTLYFNGMDTLLATARSNKVATTIVVQDMSQLRKEYGREQADVLLNLTGNVIAGQVTGDSARQLSERFGRILQERKNFHQGERSESSGVSYHLDPALPPSRMATLSSGELVGILSDGPDQPLKHKLFHGQVIKEPELPDIGLPQLEKPPSPDDIAKRYQEIKQEVRDLVAGAMDRIHHEPGLKHLRVKQKEGKRFT